MASPATNSATPPLQPSHLPDSQLRTALSRLDAVDVLALLRVQVFVFQSPPAFVRGPVRHALSIALQAILDASLIDDGHVSSQRAWKLWLLLPRMLLHRRPEQRHLSRPDWRHRLRAFHAGECLPGSDEPPRAAPAADLDAIGSNLSGDQNQ